MGVERARGREPHATAHSRRLFWLLVLPGLLAWSCLFWDRGGRFLDWYAIPSQRGPLFLPFAIYAWTMIAAGALILLRAAPRRSDGRLGLRFAIVCGALLPSSRTPSTCCCA